MNTINLTQGNDHRLRVAMTRWDEPLALSQSSDVRVYAVSRYGKKAQLVVHYSSQDEGVLEAEWPSLFPAGGYGLEVAGVLEDEGSWRMFAAGAIEVTTDTEEGGESVTMTADSFDVKGVITVCEGTTGVTEELRQVIADMIEEEYNASERVRETNEADRIANETLRQQHEAPRQQNEDRRIENERERADAESARDTAERDREAAEGERKVAEERRANAEQEREDAEVQREETFASYRQEIDDVEADVSRMREDLDRYIADMSITQDEFNEIFD